MSTRNIKFAQCPPATQAEIAVLNHESSLARYWSVLSQWPERQGTALQIADEEKKRNQFFGDASALDRLVALGQARCASYPERLETHLLAARIDSMRHHFAQAKLHVCSAENLGAAPDELLELRLALDQATGENPDALLSARQDSAKLKPSLQNLVPLAALYAERCDIEMAEQTYLQALAAYEDLSPFPLAWVCFQLGLLWGETASTTDPEQAAYWYKQALAYLPGYTHASVHLAEIYLAAGNHTQAQALLHLSLKSGDPEVFWRLEQIQQAEGNDQEAQRYHVLAVQTYESLLARHELAFADHAAEFYLSDGNSEQEYKRGFALAKLNLANRPTLRAFELTYLGARAVGDQGYASQTLAQAREKFGRHKAFGFSSFAN